MMVRLCDVGEKSVVGTLIGRIGPSGDIGLGDDAAAVRLGSRYLVASTDLVTRRTHFPRPITPFQMGWMAAAVNFSDIAAMGALPLGLLVAMGLPRETELETVEGIADGIGACAEQVSADYLGGDTKEAEDICLVGTSLGIVRTDGILLRSGARPGDLLAVTGELGLAGAGWAEIDEEDFHPLARKALLEPFPRTKEGAILSASGYVTSCMDTSDGLAMSVHELARRSGVGFTVDRRSLPVHRDTIRIGERLGLDAMDWALHSGGDYQLLFTVNPEGETRLRSMLGKGFTVIGEATREGVRLDDGERSTFLEDKGFEHFRW
jgi:thiamine-monophosphate kinase